MLEFESNKGKVTCKVIGDLSEITHDIMMAIGSIYNGIKQRDEKTASMLRVSLEEMFVHGSAINEAIFDHFDDPKKLTDAIGAKCKEKEKELLTEFKKTFKESGISKEDLISMLDMLDDANA